MKQQEKLNRLNSFVYRMKKGHQRSKDNRNNHLSTIFNIRNYSQGSTKGLCLPIKQLKEENSHKKNNEHNFNCYSLNLKNRNNKNNKQLPLFAKLFSQVENIKTKQYNTINDEVYIQKNSKNKKNSKLNRTLMHTKICLNQSFPLRIKGKQKNNLSLLLNKNYKQSKWSSPQAKQSQKYNKQIELQNETKQINNENPQIQFYNTKSIFIFKKASNENSKTGSSSLRTYTNEQTQKIFANKYQKRIIESASKYKRNKVMYKKLSFDEGKFTPLQEQFIINKSDIQQIKQNNSQKANQHQSPKHIKYSSKNKQFIKTEQSKFIQGKQKLQPWDISTQQCHEYLRLSPFAQH